jgi:hypothetical protein
MPNDITLGIGKVSISTAWNISTRKIDLPAAYHRFVGKEPPDIRLRLHRGIPEIFAAEKVFDSRPIWTLYRNDSSFVIRLFEQYPDLQRILILPHHFEHADLFFNESPDSLFDPFFGPTMELLMIHYLAKGRGIIVHACGLEYNESGILFAGESGAGKSTLARLWAANSGVEILSDDRIIVRNHNGQFWIYGTPWHGDGQFASPRGVRLKQIYFIKHGQKNAITQLSGTSSVSQFLKASFPPFWDTGGMESAMEFLSELTATVPGQEFFFRPDKSAVDFIKAQGAGL